MCHADTHPFFFVTRRSVYGLLVILVGFQLLALALVLRSNLQSVSTYGSYKVFPQLDRNFHKSLKLFVSGPLLSSIEEVHSAAAFYKFSN